MAPSRARSRRHSLCRLSGCRVGCLPGLALYRYPESMTIGGVGVVYVELAPGTRSPMLVHRRTDELIFITKGRGWGWVGGRRVALGPGSVLALPAGVPHAFATGRSALGTVALFNPPMDWSKPDAYLSDGRRIPPPRWRKGR